MVKEANTMTYRYPIKWYVNLGLLFFILCLLGCTPYPPASTGGYAAHYYLIHYPLRNPNLSYRPEIQKYGPLRAKLDQLYRSKVWRCYPARMVEMDLLAQQIAQEIVAGLLLSARRDMNLLENNIRILWPLREVKGCPKLKNDQYWQILKARIQ
ncbi:hypothetical protein Lgor_0839 [Fluoribacter gormanii]|uniref:Uncharacterized protein n=2 Tax=Fluoribacter gormanii TaxID=464 RepID=A0A377GNQ4_9GAMM|nr:hypothetical protein Lgor_0839 [Fluoribacter gormanii]SIR15700.1 hypothetical protein SAMN05421777_10771 [Fluoribacter gormanii]STO26243.1 Uncharacterised protein [Fluoribacter gormanii]